MDLSTVGLRSVDGYLGLSKNRYNKEIQVTVSEEQG